MERPQIDPANESLAMRFARLPEDDRRQFLEALSPEQQEAMLWDWQFWARPKQLEPDGTWNIWMMLMGRGAGKTRAGAEWVRSKIESGMYGRVNVVGATAADARDIIVEGPSGLMAVCPPHMGATYSPTKRKITFSSGAEIVVFSADEPERLRGHQCHGAWADEIASWRYEDAWTQLRLGLRLPSGFGPRIVVTTTPKPTRIIKRLFASPQTALTTGSTYDNWDNLAETFLDEIIQEYEGRRIGLQELHAKILDDSPGAMWKRDLIDQGRILRPELPELSRIVVAVDPAVSFDAEDGDETGIVVVGISKDGSEGYVLEDCSGRYLPDEWARRALSAYYKWEADRIVAEINQGGDMVEATFRVLDPNVSYAEVRATRGKLLRAEPVAALYERGKVHHVGFFDSLEDQMCTWEPAPVGEAARRSSPDRLDALVWGLTYLMVTPARSAIAFPTIDADSDLKHGSYWKAAEL